MSSTFKKGANAAKNTISEHVRIVNFKNSRLACLKKNIHQRAFSIYITSKLSGTGFTVIRAGNLGDNLV